MTAVPLRSPLSIVTAAGLVVSVLLALPTPSWAEDSSESPPASETPTDGAPRDDRPSDTGAATSSADASTAGQSELTRTFEPAGEPISSRRTPPDTDGLPDPKTTVGGALLWIPRTVFFPVYLATNYLVRWPLGKLFTAIEKYRVVERLTVADRPAGFLPLVSLGGDQASSFGLRFFHDELADGHLDFDIGARGMPGRNWFGMIEFDVRIPDESSVLKLRGGAKKRDDSFYYGVGRQSEADNSAARFTRRSFMGRLAWAVGGGTAPGRGLVHLDVFDRDLSCSPERPRDACGPDREFGTSADRYPSRIPQIADLGRDHTFLRGGFRAYWDSRPPHAGTGVRLQSAVTVGRGLRSTDLETFGLEAEGAGFLELPGTYRRVIGLRLRAESAAPYSGGRIPVDELVSLGGIEKMRGFREDRFRGRSLLLATLNYRYPVWSFFDGQVFAEVGELTGLYWNDVDIDRLRASAGLGLRTKKIRDRQSSYNLNLAVGSSRFGRGFRIQEVRVNLGTNWGF